MRSRALLLLAALTLLATVAQGQPAKSRKDLLRVSFVDVGQGDAIWIQGPRRADGKPGVNILIDGGPNSSEDENHLLDYLAKYELKPGATIDYVIASHPHDDHYPGLTTVLGKYEVRNIVDTGFPKPEGTASKPSTYGKFTAAARKETAGGKPARYVRLRDHPEGSISLDWTDDSASDDAPTLKADIVAGFWPGAKEMGSKQNTKENNASVVVRLKFGGISFLFMGDGEGKERSDDPDTPKYVEEFLLKKYAGKPEMLKSTVLKVGHHGSETSSTIPFIRAVQPKVLAVMSGRKLFRTVYLPDRTVLDRYKKEVPGITIVRTDRDDEDEDRDTTTDADGDDVYMYTDGQSLRVFQAALVNNKWKWVSVKSVQADDSDHP